MIPVDQFLFGVHQDKKYVIVFQEFGKLLFRYRPLLVLQSREHFPVTFNMIK